MDDFFKIINNGKRITKPKYYLFTEESLRSRLLKNLQKIGPPMFYLSLLFFYFSFFLIVK